jgi:hypothetical protein
MTLQHLVTRTVVVIAAMAATAAPSVRATESALPIFAAVGLTPAEIGAVDDGRAVAKVLSWGGPSEVYVFGAVRIDGAADVYLKAVRDISRLRATHGFLGAGELRAGASAADLTSIVFDEDDVKALKDCREGSCDVQLPAASIDAFRNRIDWSRRDSGEQVNALARPMLQELLRSYQLGGNEALGDYRDKKNPARIAAQFETMMERASVLPDVLPELRRYLIDYPNAALPGADSYFYWEKVDFGLKPTLRLNHAVIYRTRTPDRHVATVAIKQLYATHYFHTALDVSACVEDAVGARRGFYLLTLKGSSQAGLTGPKGSLLRNVGVEKTRTALERALAAVKHMVEGH